MKTNQKIVGKMFCLSKKDTAMKKKKNKKYSRSQKKIETYKTEY